MNMRDEGERALVLADEHLAAGDREAATSALDRAHGLIPEDDAIARQRRGLLDELSLTEHGLVWRYVPSGSFMMGSADGDPDERPVHSRHVDAFWMTDVPITWTAYCALLGWAPPPHGQPRAGDPRLVERARSVSPGFMLTQLAKIRQQYCENESERARDWHNHAEDAQERVLAFDRKPMIATSPGEAEDLANALTKETPSVRYSLPTEAEWEKAARGGLIGRRYAWGDDPPTRAHCDFDRFGAFHLEDPRDYPANGYGLHSMCGGVAEWTADPYDALAYRQAAPAPNQARVMRGGSWADCATAVTVSFRASLDQARWDEAQRRSAAGWGSPTVGFRLIRQNF